MSAMTEGARGIAGQARNDDRGDDVGAAFCRPLSVPTHHRYAGVIRAAECRPYTGSSKLGCRGYACMIK